MTDEQLTRRAAEVMGLNMSPYGESYHPCWLGDPDLLWLPSEGSANHLYAPLHDTDQAMDLAAELGIDIKWHDSHVNCMSDNGHAFVAFVNCPVKKAAMRRAIVECACG